MGDTAAVSADPPNARESREAQVEATLAIALVMGLQATLAIVSLSYGWEIWGLPGWLWFIPIVPEFLLVVALTLHVQRHGTEQLGTRRKFSLALVGLITVVNVAALIILIGSLLTSQEQNGSELLFKAVTIWSTNVVAFGLLFWDLDGGGPMARTGGSVRERDFQFPQMENPTLAPTDWHPRLFDYVYISFTNSIAFSPTDAMPLTRRAKSFMLVESGISVCTVLLAAARAVNILK